MSTRKKTNVATTEDSTVVSTAKAAPVKPTGGKKADKLLSNKEPSKTENAVSIPLDLIDLSPLNYRKYHDPVELEGLGKSIKAHGLIQPVTVRIVKKGRYELIVGERRVLASRLAGLTEIDALIRFMDDQQVIIAQFTENLDRLDPHPMEEAIGIGRMLAIKKTVKEIALTMVKPEKFVYERIKLLRLNSNIQEMFLAGRFSITNSLEIADLSPEAQSAFYENHCKDWKESEKLPFSNLHSLLSKYHCNLKQAPFEISDANLNPAMGPCTSCQFNTACATSLFPADASKATCTMQSCYEGKSKTSLRNSIVRAVKEHGATALIYDGYYKREPFEEMVKELPDGITLEVYSTYEISRVLEPEMPEKEDFTYDPNDEGNSYDEDDDDEVGEDEFYGRSSYEDGDTMEDDDPDEFGPEDDDEDDPDEDDTPMRAQADEVEEKPVNSEAPEAIEFDEDGYNYAMEQFQKDMLVYQQKLAQLCPKTAIQASGQKVLIFKYILRPDNDSTSKNETLKRLTSKEVHAHIKARTDTIPMLEAEIERIDEWTSTKEFGDRTKIQETAHEHFSKFVDLKKTDASITEMDWAGLFWITFENLDYSNKDKVRKILFPENAKDHDEFNVNNFRDLTDGDISYLARKVILGRDASKRPNDIAAKILYEMARPWIDLSRIEQEQQDKADQRRSNQEKKKEHLEKRIRKLDPTRLPKIPVWADAVAVTDCQTPKEFLEKYMRAEDETGFNEGALDRALYAANEEIKSAGFASLQPFQSTTNKLVTFIPPKQ